MTVQRAIKLLDCMAAQTMPLPLGDDGIKAVEMAIEALEKQFHKKVIKEQSECYAMTKDGVGRYEITLRKCPCCGGEAKICGYYFIQCVKCGLSTLTHTNRESAINTWNTRTPLKRVIKHLEEERRLADEEKERCAMESLFQFDRAVGYSNGIFNAIELIKGEME